MKRRIRKFKIIVDRRYTYSFIGIFVMTLLLMSRLWYLQIYRGDHYSLLSKRNRIRKVEIPAARGSIFDREKRPVLTNKPFFDLTLIPQFSRDRENTFKALSLLLHIPIEHLKKRYQYGRGAESYMPIILKRNLTLHEVSLIESNRVFLPGIEVRRTLRRNYKSSTPPHLVGYLAEIDRATLKRRNADLAEGQHPYRPGDLIGKQGLERRYEPLLRGKPGYSFIQVDAFGHKLKGKQDFNLDLPRIPAAPGHDLELTLDMALQKEVNSAFKGKYGSVVVMNPQNGEILAFNSSPGYAPKKFQRGLSTAEWQTLLKHPYKPLYDKTTGGEYPPGSLYKPIVAAAALEENLVTQYTTFECPGYFELGNEKFKCWNHGGHGTVDLKMAMMQSCDVYFYEIGVQLGVDKIARYARQFGLGESLGLELNSEKSGLIPTSAWKKFTHRVPWTAGDTPNVSIGQGYNLLTPLQMASMFATIGNGGKVWRPFILKRIVNHIGQVKKEINPLLLSKIDLISENTFKILSDVLMAVVEDEKGTGKKARVEGHKVAGKTGSVQVVSLKKYNNRSDVSFKWKEHAMFAAFSPVENPEIAISIVSENDLAGGGGGSAAAPIAGKILEAYWRLKDGKNNPPKVAKVPAKTGGKHVQ